MNRLTVAWRVLRGKYLVARTGFTSDLSNEHSSITPGCRKLGRDEGIVMNINGLSMPYRLDMGEARDTLTLLVVVQ